MSFDDVSDLAAVVYFIFYFTMDMQPPGSRRLRENTLLLGTRVYNTRHHRCSQRTSFSGYRWVLAVAAVQNPKILPVLAVCAQTTASTGGTRSIERRISTSSIRGIEPRNSVSTRCVCSITDGTRNPQLRFEYGQYPVYQTPEYFCMKQ